METDKILGVERDHEAFSIGDFVRINQSFPKQIVGFKTMKGKIYAGFDYGKKDGVMYNEISELVKIQYYENE